MLTCACYFSDAVITVHTAQAGLKKRLRRAAHGFVGLWLIAVLFICFAVCSGPSLDSDGPPGSEPCQGGAGCCGILLIVFFACGYTNKDLFNPDLTPYFVGCGSQAESVGAYSIGSMRTTLEPTLKLDGSEIAIDGSGDSTLPATVPITEPDEVGMPGGVIAAIVVAIAIAIAGSTLFVCSRRRRGAAQEEKGSQNRAAAEAQVGAQAEAQGQLHLERVQREQLAAQNSSAAAEAKVQLEHEQLAAQNVVQNRAAAAFHPTPAYKMSTVTMC